MSPSEGTALNTTSHPTQRRLIIALVVTLACLPLVALDLLGGHGGGGTSEDAVVNTDVPESSLVVAISPATTPITEPPSTTTAPPATAAPSTTAPKAAAAAKPSTTTTTAPKAAAAAKPSTTTTTAPKAAAPPAPTTTGWEAEFMACVRWRESRNNYGAVDPTGRFMGAYQIYQGGWDAVASGMGRGDLVGVPPHHAGPADQDAVALAMLRQYGTAPWAGTCG